MLHKRCNTKTDELGQQMQGIKGINQWQLIEDNLNFLRAAVFVGSVHYTWPGAVSWLWDDVSSSGQTRPLQHFSLAVNP